MDRHGHGSVPCGFARVKLGDIGEINSLGGVDVRSTASPIGLVA